jgi:hypothetical protein
MTLNKGHCDNGAMVTNKRLPFDPESRGAQQLLRMMRSAPEFEKQVDVVLKLPYQRVVGERGTLYTENHETGERLTLPRSQADSLVSRGIAELA